MQTNVSSFVWGNNGQLVSFVTKAQGLEPQAFFYCHDGNKNVTDLVNASGAIVAHYEYDPFGNQVVKSGVLADTNPFRFSNEYYDSETGFTTYLYRPYNPETGAWLSRDPIGTRGGLNVYGFTGNRSISLTDFQGLSVALPQNEGRLNLKASGVVDIFNYLDMEVLLVSGSGMDSEFDKDTNTATIDMEHDDPWSQLVHEVVGGSIWGSGGNPDSFGFPGAVKYYDTQTVSIIGEMLARIDRNNGEDRLGVALEQHLQQHTGSYTYSYPKALKIVEFVKACECGGGFRDDERVVSQISDSVGSPVSGFVTGRLKVIVKIVYEVGCRNRKPWADYEIGYYK
jgi:RHS repeat-associated protein